MDCPSCKVATQVVHTEKVGEQYVRRVRYCNHCKRAFSSTELYDETYDKPMEAIAANGK
jgi:transcriptional regulator NrdR family protein